MPFLSGVKLAGLAAVLLAVWLGYRWFTGIVEENATLKRNNDALTVTLESEKAAREAIAAAREQDARISAEAIQRAAERAGRANAIKQEVIHAPPVAAGCAPVGPAVGIVLDRLRNAAGGDKAGGHPPQAAGQPATVRPGTAGP